MHIFLNSERELRSLWWIAIFFLVLAGLTLPAIILTTQYAWELSFTHQALIILIATWITQRLRRKSFSEISGRIDRTWLRNLFQGFAAGCALMIFPALLLSVTGQITWQLNHAGLNAFVSATLFFLAVAVAEEFLFRGFIFQRLIKATGVWFAQLLIAILFLLTHMNNPGMTGSAMVLASINIFMASIMFGLAFFRTGNLAMPVALHFAANWMQGAILGFGVSGNDSKGLLTPVITGAPQWLTGGAFGIEASLPGLFTVILITYLLYRWKPRDNFPVNNH